MRHKAAGIGMIAALALGAASCGSDADAPADAAGGADTAGADAGADAGVDVTTGEDTAPALESCSNLIDDDGDGLVDCDDPDCDRVDCEGPVACPDVDLGERVGYPVWTGTTRGAGHSGGGSCGGQRGEDVHVLWTAPATDSYTFTTAGSSIDTIFYALQDDCDGEELVCNDDEHPQTLQSGFTLELQASDTIVLVIDGYEVIGGNGGGAVSLNITPATLEREAGFCGDGVDNDDDGAIDCLDEDCADTEGCEPLTGAVALTAGDEHVCAVLGGGTAVCWGRGGGGRLGVGDTTRRRRPAQVNALVGIEQMSAGREHTCAAAMGSAWCWGRGWNGELGTGDTQVELLPVELNGPQGVTAVAAAISGNHSCEVDGTNAVWCHGYNWAGQVNSSDTYSFLEPTRVTSAPGAIAIDAGTQHTCLLTGDGEVWCWGRGSDGQLGNGTVDARRGPTRVELDDVIDVDAGGSHTCAVRGDGTVWCWGRSYQAEVGVVSDVPVRSPRQVTQVSDAVDVSCGTNHSCAVTGAGEVWCWGVNYDGRTAPDQIETQSVVTPRRVPGVRGATAVSAGARHTCAIVADGAVVCWGSDDGGQLGGGAAGLAPGPVRVLDYEVVPPPRDEPDGGADAGDVPDAG